MRWVSICAVLVSWLILIIHNIRIVGTLVRKVRKYGKELEVRRHHLQRLELSCDKSDIARWEIARRDMEEMRVKDPYYADEFWNKDVVTQGDSWLSSAFVSPGV